MYKLPCPNNVLYLGSVGKAATSQGRELGGRGGGAGSLNEETTRGQRG